MRMESSTPRTVNPTTVDRATESSSERVLFLSHHSWPFDVQLGIHVCCDAATRNCFTQKIFYLGIFETKLFGLDDLELFELANQSLGVGIVEA